MANILTINSDNPGQGRPLRLSDLQALWGAIGSLFVAGPQQSTPVILWGFQLQSDNTFSAGALSYAGQLYYYPASTTDKLSVGGSVYVDTVPSGDVRVIEGGTSQQFSSYNIVTGKESDTSTFLFDIATDAAVDAFRCAMMMTNGQIPGAMLKHGTVGPGQLAKGAVTSTALAQPYRNVGWSSSYVEYSENTNIYLSTLVSSTGTSTNSTIVKPVVLTNGATLTLTIPNTIRWFDSLPGLIPLVFYVIGGGTQCGVSILFDVSTPTGVSSMTSLNLLGSAFISVILAKVGSMYKPVGYTAV